MLNKTRGKSYLLAHLKFAYLFPISLIFSAAFGNIAIGAKSAWAQKTDADLPNVEGQVKPRKGDANTLRSLQGEPVTPTNGNLFDRSVSDPTSDVNLHKTEINFVPIIPVTPAIPNASPQSPTLNVPGVFTSDPLHAIPLFQGSGDADSKPQKDPQKGRK
ncbi:hypothetical protein V2H45_10000 [Tumidithrix elongata RA019]|uniref:Uncharacterized protein n=1 Tax=Tumidithrix elongata BACA0141 TaxID=2716417 RepID=A0AAW9PVV9_9CYAN|nr:hypothetical protein [Tumidithrix elongata RA019]